MPTTDPTTPDPATIDPTTSGSAGGAVTLRRRGLMVGVAAAVAGAAFVGSEHSVSAADPNDVILGGSNTTTTSTLIRNTRTSSATALVLVADEAPIGIGLEATATTYGVWGTSRDGTGVYGRTVGGVGVRGSHLGSLASGVGVHGNTPTGKGVVGDSTSGVGVVGTVGGSGNQSTVTGAGVVGEAPVPDGVGGSFSGQRAALRLVPAAAAGAPSTGAHDVGEFVVDSAGQLFFCQLAGTPGSWLPIGSASSAAAAFETLSTPERFVDTRIGLGGVQGPVAAGTTHTFAMAARSGVPADATAIVGNLTAAGAADSAGGYLTLWPGDALPNVSNLNYGPFAPIANSFVVRLQSGSLNLYNFKACDYIIDVTGFYR